MTDWDWYRRGLEDGQDGTFLATLSGLTLAEVHEYEQGWELGTRLRAFRKGKMILCR